LAQGQKQYQQQLTYLNLYRNSNMLKFEIFLLILIGDGLKLKYEETHTDKSDNLCEISDNHVKPWRARALCDLGQVGSLNTYLQVEKEHLESLSLEDVETAGKNRRRKKNRGNRRRKNNGTNDNSDLGTQIYKGKFCAQGDPDGRPKSGGNAIASVVYVHKAGNTSVTTFKAGDKCYNANCTGICGQVDMSVKFSCSGAADARKLKATWFRKFECVATESTEKDDKGNDVVINHDAEEYYNAGQVTLSNSGTEAKFCWGNSHLGASTFHPYKNADDDQKYEYYYSYSSSQLLPTC